MFTEGLDETAIQWINKGSQQQQQRSPLSENSTLPISPPLLPTISNNLTPKSPSLPPLKFFHSPLLPPPNLAFRFPDDDDNSVTDNDDDESVASLHCPVIETDDDDDCEDIEDERVLDSLDTPIAHCYDEDQLFGIGGASTKPKSSKTLKSSGILRKGLVNENLTIQLPNPNSVNVRRFTDGELGFNNFVQKKIMTPCGSGIGTGTSFNNDPVELNTPSAPPIFIDGESGDLCYSEDSVANVVDEMPQQQHGSWTSRDSVNCDNNEGGGRSECSIEQKPNTVSESSCNSQHAWQTLITYDACIRLCLQAWARGCTEAPEFLKDECLALRSAFGLHEFLLQPRGIKPTEGSTRNSEQTVPFKTKKVVGKIRVEVKKLRIIQRRKLKSSFSNRGSMYKQAGMEYVRHVSSLVKSGINSMKSASFSATTEEPLYCLIQLKSATEENASESCSAIFLRPGSGDYHDFFPLSQGDALLVEVQDSKKAVHGEARIPISYLNDNPSDRIRWWPINHDDNECVGKIQLSIGSTMTSDDNNHIKSAPVVETQAYDIVLEGAMRAQHFHSRNLRLNGPWKWLLDAFADYYGVSSSYSKLRYLLQVMNVATPTKDCLELVKELLDPLIKARGERSLTRQERSILLDCETQIEGLLATVFENYKSLDENSPTGLTDHFGPASDSAAPALHPALQVYSSLHDILSPDAQTILQNYLQTAARKRCRKHMMETDEFVSGASESYLMDTITISTAYLKMKNLCISIRNEIQADIKINGQNTIHGRHIFPSLSTLGDAVSLSIDLANITAAIYSTELCKRLRTFLSAWPPSSPQTHVNELLVATADFERDLESWNISSVQGGVDSRNLFHNYIMVWIQDMQLSLLDLCKAEKVPWAGVTTNHSTSPFAEKMYDDIKDNLIQYEVVINRWPQYSLYLENAVANVERAIVKSLEKQYSDILTPLKDSIPKRLHLQVQKLARRQSASVQLVPNQLGIFLNTIKRILDVLHCRVEDVLNSWARCCLPVMGDKKLFGEQMNGITVLLRTRYKTYLQAIIGNLVNNIQGNKSTRLKKMLEETREADGEAEVRERMQLLNSQLVEFISNLHEVFTSQIFIAICRGLWDRMGQIILKFLEGRKENRIWYNGSCYALGILDDTFASQMQRLKGNALHEKDIEPPRSVIEARSILCKDTTNANDTSTYFYI
ncbi:hypothetical protein TSUD_255020 [Trifolium subterraneum]|uniref:Uncharacterized protein n=2 Tax=Trifolium TaxID=3898 RepID=A0A2Z6LNM1_TRISU|nr:hypothetical protein TSUD_255020 [Trifolium subterraneum]